MEGDPGRGETSCTFSRAATGSHCRSSKKLSGTPTGIALGSCRYLGLLVYLQNRLAALAGADANRLLHRQDEDLPVADLARASVLEDRLDDEALVLVLHHNLDLELRPHVDGERRASILLDDPLLPAGALG